MHKKAISAIQAACILGFTWDPSDGPWKETMYDDIECDYAQLSHGCHATNGRGYVESNWYHRKRLCSLYREARPQRLLQSRVALEG